MLDACAAPGGKTAHLLELADLDLLALDSDPAGLARVDETLAPPRPRGRDPRRRRRHAGRLVGRPAFDAILLDAPCSASGIVRRHPDVRWLRRADDIAALAAIQARLLDALWPLLAPGGRLLYCTCSVFKAEGQEQIDAFLQRQDAAGPVCRPAVRPGTCCRCPTMHDTGRPPPRLPRPGGRLLLRPAREDLVHAEDRPLMTPLPPHGSLRRRSVLRALGVAASRLLLPGVWVAAAAGSAAVRAAEAELTVLEVGRDEDGVLLELRGRLRRSRKAVDDALSKAVPLYFVAEAEVFRDRWYWRDQRVADALRVWRVVLPAADLDLPRDDLRRPEPELRRPGPRRCAAISRGARWKIAEAGADRRRAASYYVEFSFRLDTSLLPRPMQIGIGGQADWTLSVQRTLRIN